MRSDRSIDSHRARLFLGWAVRSGVSIMSVYVSKTRHAPLEGNKDDEP